MELHAALLAGPAVPIGVQDHRVQPGVHVGVETAERRLERSLSDARAGQDDALGGRHSEILSNPQQRITWARVPVAPTRARRSSGSLVRMTSLSAEMTAR